jgi:hypothetical protein
MCCEGSSVIAVPAGICVLVATMPVGFRRGADGLVALGAGSVPVTTISDAVMRLSASQLAALVDAMDWSRLHAHDVRRPTATS